MKRTKCVYVFFDQHGVPVYVGQGRWARPEDHFKPEQWNGRERTPFYQWVREELAASRRPRFLRVLTELTAVEARSWESALIESLGRAVEGRGTLLNADTRLRAGSHAGKRRRLARGGYARESSRVQPA